MAMQLLRSFGTVSPLGSFVRFHRSLTRRLRLDKPQKLYGVMVIESEDEVDEPEFRCKTCDRELTQGMDVTTVQHGVLGSRGLVPLEDATCFCSWKCLEEYCCDGLEEASRGENDGMGQDVAESLGERE